MLHRVLETLVEKFAEAVDKQVQSISDWTLGGLLQILMEVEFLTLILSNYFTDRANTLFQELYQLIKTKTSAIEQEFDSTAMQKGLEFVKQTISHTQKTTKIQFLCFKQ
eukprot:NODE_517_length_7343_cov_0.253313.p7 type:complete len:109 gc:universal NODE_517_length_7343_cov_0.253313:2207-1881(-)